MSYDSAYQPYGGQGSGPFGGYPSLRTDGVLSRRLLAYLVDIVVISILVVVSSFLIGVAGFLTFGLGWMLYAILVPGTAILYSAITVGGSGQGTVGMRLFSLRAIDSTTGGPVGGLVAALHALLFYGAASTFLLLVADIVIGMARADRRLGHDLLVGVLLVRRA